jgi:hypothetical protein
MSTLAHTLATFAHTHTATHNYAFLVKQSHAVYAVWLENVTVEDIETLSYLDVPAKKHATRGATLRYKGRQGVAYKLGLQRHCAQCIGTRASWDADFKAFKAAYPKCKNEGDFFEYVIARMNNLFWDGHNSDDGRVKGDLIINGVHWQLKANGGNFANESQMRRW